MNTEEKIDFFRNAPNETIGCVSDFDRTLTPNRIDGKRISTSPSRFRDSGILGEKYTQKAQALFNRYYPIEQDPSISIADKDAVLTQWWTQHLELLVQSRVSQSMFEQVVDDGIPFFRTRVRDALQLLQRHHVPLAICSSGLGDFIRVFLDRQELEKHDISLCSNVFQFDTNGIAIDYNRPIFHSHSKSHVWDYLRGDSLFDDRKNIIVLGDSLGDLTMANDDGSHHFLTIGFCNESDSQNRQAFENAFDIVVYGDGDFAPVYELFERIFSA